MKRKKVLFFLPSTTGGAERMTINIAKMLPPEHFAVKFVIVHKDLGTITDFVPQCFEYIHLPIRNIYCGTTFRMARIIKKEQADIVFSSALYLNVRLIIAAKLCGVKVIVRNNIDLSKTKSYANVFLVKHTYRWADKVIAQQEEMHDEIIDYTGLPKDRVITLHNPIDEELIAQKTKVASPYPDKTHTNFVWVGRFSEEKGQDIAVKAIEIVRKHISNAHLYLIGKYDDRKTYDKAIIDYIASHGMHNYVHMIGFDNNPYRWVKYCDCYVMPSRLEGLPNSLIDAMYLGVPVAASKCIPVIERIVKDGYNGYLAESGNTESIANAMQKAIDLRNFEMTYKPADKSDFIELFEI